MQSIRILEDKNSSWRLNVNWCLIGSLSENNLSYPDGNYMASFLYLYC